MPWQVLDPAYLERYYTAETPGGGPAWHELYLECADSAALAPFQTRSADIRALAGQTALFYSVAQAVGSGSGLGFLIICTGCVQGLQCMLSWSITVGKVNDVARPRLG